MKPMTSYPSQVEMRKIWLLSILYPFLCWMLLSPHWHSSLWGEKNPTQSVSLWFSCTNTRVLFAGFILQDIQPILYPFFFNVIHNRGLELGDFKGPFQNKSFNDSVKKIMPHFKTVLQSSFLKMHTLLLLSILLGPSHLHLSPEMISNCSEIALA